MITPSTTDLLNGVALSLEELVVTELPPGEARRQLEAAIRIIRRVAFTDERYTPYLYADNADIAATLREVLPALDRLAASPHAAELAAACGRLRAALARMDGYDELYPSVALLRERNRQLQQLLADVREALSPAAGAERDEILKTLRALFRRMLARQLELAPPSPFGR